MSSGNHHSAYLRALRTAEKEQQQYGEYEQTMFFAKGFHRGRLAVWEHHMEWDVFADPDCGQHLDWNHPDCKCLDGLGSPVNILYVLSTLADYGFSFLSAYDKDNHIVEI